MQESDKANFAALVTGVMDVYGSKATQASLSIWWAALQRFPFEAVRSGLSAHVQDPIAGKFAPKPADIIGKLQSMDGRPGPEEAWSMIPRDESSSVVWTEEMAEAFGVANPLLNEGDQVAARMAFTERYRALVQQARDAGKPVKWMPSLGTDRLGREGALLEAESKGRLTSEHVAGLLPYREEQGAMLLAKLKQLAAPKVVQDKPIPNPLEAA